MKIQIIYQNKIQNASYCAAIAEYTKRLQAFAKVELICMDTCQTVPKGIYIEITRHGSTIQSETLARQLGDYMTSGCSDILFSFVPLDRIPDATLCLSGLKLSEPLSLTVLCEQLYRGFMILNNRTYHK